MKILQITGEYPPLIQGGLGVYVDEIVNQLTEFGHDIDVLLLTGDKSVYNKIKTHKPQHKQLFLKKIKSKRLDQLLRNKHITARELLQWCQMETLSNQNYDLIHVHDWYGVLWGSALKFYRDTPMVMTSHLPTRAGFTYTGHNVSLKLKMQLEHLGFRVADKILVPSFSVRDTLVNEYNIDAQKITVIPNGVNQKTFASKCVKKSTSHKIVWASRLSEQKGLFYLLDVLRELNKRQVVYECTIVGTGALENDLKKEIKRLSLEKQVLITGFLEHQNLNKIYRDSSVFVNTSIYEPFGLVILEAMSSGTPVVSFDVGGISEIVDSNANGVLVPVCRVDQMTDEIAKILNDTAYARSLSKAAIGKASLYTWDKIVSRLVSIYQQVIKTYD